MNTEEKIVLTRQPVGHELALVLIETSMGARCELHDVDGAVITVFPDELEHLIEELALLRGKLCD